MPLARFVAIHDVPEVEHSRVGQARFAVVLAHRPSGVVLVFNLYRKVWELPGGLIDPGESPREAAARELAEEAGAAVDALRWLGLVEVHDGATHFGAVYHGTVTSLVRIDSDEVAGISSWTTAGHPDPLGHTDAALLERFGSAAF
jgi:8-oxo-dGTP pyrophosphatase MutT (NUDIX family)